MAEVRLVDVVKKFKDVVAVENVNLNIKDKEFVVLVGPSGCGKTTTLRLVAGLEELTSGDIYIDERKVNDVAPKDRDIAMVFQNYALYPHMDVYNNMAFGLKLRKFPKDEIDRRVNEAAEILGIKHLLKRKPKELSGGQRQRVAVGRAIVRKPKVFLFDEPLSNLDAKLRVQMRTELSRLHKRLEATMIYVTHDQVEAMTMGDRIVVMRDGHVQQIGAPLELYDHPANKFVAGFIGSPAMNFIDSKVIKKDSKYYVDAESFQVKIPEKFYDKVSEIEGKDVIFGIRPEDMRDKEFVQNVDPEYVIKAKVEVIEPMGAENFLYLTSGKHYFISRVDSRSKAKEDAYIELALDMEKMHLFDPKTEVAII